jgi:hypothetical protein
VTGLAEQPPTAPSLFEVARVGEGLDDRRANVRDLDAVRAIVADVRPEVVIHVARGRVGRHVSRPGADAPDRAHAPGMVSSPRS